MRLYKNVCPETAPPKIERAHWHVRISWSINSLESSWGPKASLWKKVFDGSKNKGKLFRNGTKVDTLTLAYALR
jgi:hypothetical protein